MLKNVFNAFAVIVTIFVPLTSLVLGLAVFIVLLGGGVYALTLMILFPIVLHYCFSKKSGINIRNVQTIALVTNSFWPSVFSALLIFDIHSLSPIQKAFLAVPEMMWGIAFGVWLLTVASALYLATSAANDQSKRLN